jgi:hypothetical protein
LCCHSAARPSRAAGFSTEFSSLASEKRCHSVCRSTHDDDEHGSLNTMRRKRFAASTPGVARSRRGVRRRNPRARHRGDGTHHEAVPPPPLWVYRWRQPERSARERLSDAAEVRGPAFLPLAHAARDLASENEPRVKLDLSLPASFSLLFDDALELRVRRARHDSGARRGRATSAALAEKPLTRRQDLTKLTPSPFPLCEENVASFTDASPQRRPLSPLSFVAKDPPCRPRRGRRGDHDVGRFRAAARPRGRSRAGRRGGRARREVALGRARSADDRRTWTQCCRVECRRSTQSPRSRRLGGAHERWKPPRC